MSDTDKSNPNCLEQKGRQVALLMQVFRAGSSRSTNRWVAEAHMWPWAPGISLSSNLAFFYIDFLLGCLSWIPLWWKAVCKQFQASSSSLTFMDSSYTHSGPDSYKSEWDHMLVLESGPPRPLTLTVMEASFSMGIMTTIMSANKCAPGSWLWRHVGTWPFACVCDFRRWVWAPENHGFSTWF